MKKTDSKPNGDSLRQFVRSSLEYCVKAEEQRRFATLDFDDYGFWTFPVDISVRPDEEWPL